MHKNTAIMIDDMNGLKKFLMQEMNEIITVKFAEFSMDKELLRPIPLFFPIY